MFQKDVIVYIVSSRDCTRSQNTIQKRSNKGSDLIERLFGFRSNVERKITPFGKQTLIKFILTLYSGQQSSILIVSR